MMHLAVIALSGYTDRYSSKTGNNFVIQKKLESHGVKTTLYEETFTTDYLGSPSVDCIINSLAKAYKNTSIDGILAYLGGRTCIKLLSHLPYNLINQYSKPIIGYSDITILLNAIYTSTGNSGIHGPLFVDHGMLLGNTYIGTLKKLLEKKSHIQYTQKENYDDGTRRIESSAQYISLPQRKWIKKGKTNGILVGGNLTSFVALCGTIYFPNLENKIILIEDDECENVGRIHRSLHTLSLQPGFDKIQGLCFGSFHASTGISTKQIQELINNIPAIRSLTVPIVGNIETGHTYPQNYFKVGGVYELNSILNTITCVS